MFSAFWHDQFTPVALSQHDKQQQYHSLLQLCRTSSQWEQLRCLVTSQGSVFGQLLWPVFRFAWATFVAHPADFGLAAAMLLPHLLLMLAAVLQLLRWSSQGAAAQQVNRPVVRLLGATGPAGAAMFLAVAKLLPMACSVLVLFTGWCGLRQQHPASQALQLMHPLTAILSGVMTLLSQVGFDSACAC